MRYVVMAFVLGMMFFMFGALMVDSWYDPPVQ